MLKGKEAPYRLDAMSVEDYPDLLYRGQMIDIARNFTTVDNLKSWWTFRFLQMNVLHFHFRMMRHGVWKFRDWKS